MKLIKCCVYIAVTGFICFLIGRIIPRRYIDENKFPYKSYGFEQNGKIYRKLGIHHWMNRLPDMSKIFYRIMAPKKLMGHTMESVSIMIKETCIAELIHLILCLVGLYCIKIWCGLGGIIIFAANIIGNIPYILIQRYNRPRLLNLRKGYSNIYEKTGSGLQKIQN